MWWYTLHVLLSFSAGKLSQIVILTAFHELESLKTFSFCFLVLFGSSVSQKGSLPFLLMSSSLRLTKLAMVVGRLDRSLSGMLSFFKAWQLKSCYGNTRGGKKQCNIIVCRQKSNRPLVERYKRTESIKSAGGMHRLMLWKSSAI